MKKLELRSGPVHTYVRHLPHAPAKVFRALTEAASLRAWFPAAVSGEPVAGAALVFDEAGARTRGEVLVCEPPHRLEYTFGDETLRFRVTEAPGGSVLVLVTEDAREGAREVVSVNDAPANDTACTKALLRAA